MLNGQEPNTGIRRIVRAGGYSMAGIRNAFRHEAAFRQELGLALILCPLGIWLGENGIERALMVGSLMVVLITELLNTGIEAAIDRIGPEHHPLSGRAKDIGSAAVFLSLWLVPVVWGLILLDRM